jgi:hypothetical protein
MASIWMEERGKEPRKLSGGLSPLAAAALFEESCKAWPGEKLRDGLYCLLWREGDAFDLPFGMLVLELMSPPSRADRGEQRRTTANRKQDR